MTTTKGGGGGGGGSGSSSAVGNTVPNAASNSDSNTNSNCHHHHHHHHHHLRRSSPPPPPPALPLPPPPPPHHHHHHHQVVSGIGHPSTGISDSPNPEILLALFARNKALQATIPRCAGCDHAIFDRFILKVLERPWHAKCLKCADCSAQLADKCFARNGQLFCKDDFFKRFGTKCAGCELGIPPTQIVRRAQENVYHLHCFACIMCNRQLNTGDEFYLMEDNKLVCKTDYESAKSKDGDGGNKRPRTTITAKQLETLKSAYNTSPKPARHVREQLSQDTGLDMRVVQVWFQNRRAKEKRLKKDAGRSRWGHYFRNMKPNRNRDKRRASEDRASSIDDLDKDQSYQDDVINSDIGSNSDSYGGGGPMTLLDRDSHHPIGPHLPSGGPGGVFLPSSESGGGPFNGLHSTLGPGTPPYLSGSHSPLPGAQPGGFPYGDTLIYPGTTNTTTTTAAATVQSGAHGVSRLINTSGPGSDTSNTSSNQGYPEFPPSPASWLDDVDSSTHASQY